MRPLCPALLAIVVIFTPDFAVAHGGGLDASGCHHNRKSGDYHCHNNSAVPTAGELGNAKAPSATQTLVPRTRSITTFAHAKRVLQASIYSDPEIRRAFYSRCTFEPREKQLRVRWESCGFKPRKNATRAARIEWEHLVSAWAIGHQRLCWQQGGRKNCARNDPLFAMAEADLHNVVPAIGEINGDRSNYRFTELGEPFDQYGAVPIRINFQQRAVEPPPWTKGDIARANFYMAETYGLSLSSAQKRLFQVWDRHDLPDTWECERNRRIALIQGNDNPYITRACPSV